MKAAVPVEIIKMQKNQIYFCLFFLQMQTNLVLNDLWLLSDKVS